MTFILNVFTVIKEDVLLNVVPFPTDLQWHTLESIQNGGFSPLADKFFQSLHGVLRTINTSNFAWEAEHGSTEAFTLVTTFESQGSLKGFTIGVNSIRAQIQRCPSRPFSIQVTNCVGSYRICLELPRFYGKFLSSLIDKLVNVYIVRPSLYEFWQISLNEIPDAATWKEMCSLSSYTVISYVTRF